MQVCGDSEVAEKWINGTSAMGQKYKETIGRIQKTLHSWRKRKVTYLVGVVDDNVKHVLREHNQEADHRANLGAEGQR